MSRRARPFFPRRTRRRPRQAVVLIVAVLAAIAYRHWHPPAPPPPEALSEETAYQVKRVVDGDTIVLGNNARVRLIGADTPETVKPNWPVEPWGPEATRFTRDFLAGGTVQLQLDRERVDKYGRFLAYVWVDDRMLNEELIRAGLARAKTQYRYSPSMKGRFRRAEEEARAADRAIWSGGTGPSR